MKKKERNKEAKRKDEEGKTPPLPEGILYRRVSEEGGEKDYRRKKAAGKNL